MNNKMPRTPFSTGLSRSVRETEIRIRNLFSGPKKRPPIPLMALIALLILLCGNLVAFRPLPVKPTLVMETQYYDTNGNYIEIPALALPAGEKNEAVEAINAALNDLRGQYSGPLSGSGDFSEEQCLFYPSTTSRYLNLLFYRDTFTTDLNTGHVFSLVYDLKEGTLVSTEDALARAGLNEKGLLDQVTEQVQTQIDRDYQEYDFQLALHNLTLEGFRIKVDGQPVFYLTGRVDDVDDAVNDAISGADHLYIWEDRVVSVYNQYSTEKFPLVPAGETDQLDPPLWNQWYFAGEEPQGGFVDTSIETEAKDVLPTEDEVLEVRKLALYGMSTEQVERLNLVIKEANLWWEHMYLFEDIFSNLADPDSLFWNYFDQTGEIQVSWAIEGNLDKVSICEQEHLTENEFYAKYGVKVEANNPYNADDFASVLNELVAYTQNNELKTILEYIRDEIQLAKDNHSMEHANNAYKVLHDLDYYLLRYGPYDVGPYAKDNSTILKYYGTLSFYE